MSSFAKFLQVSTSQELVEGERPFHVSGSKLTFTRGQEMITVDITKASPRDVAHEVIAAIVVCDAMLKLSKELKRDPSIEELAEAADDAAYSFGLKTAQHALHMGANDFKKIVEDLFPGLDKEAPKEDEEELKEAAALLECDIEDNVKVGRTVRWHNKANDRYMAGKIVKVAADKVVVTDEKFGTDNTHQVKFEDIKRITDGKQIFYPKVK